MSETSASTSDIEIKKAAQLSIAEIGLGSIGHGFKIPLTGHVLSLNQLGFLLNALNRDLLPRYSTFEISSIAAILKSFSPAGQKLGPMLSIAMQGFLFWFSTVILGTGIIGQIFGALLMSLWAFIQPLITLFFIYGPDLTKLYDFYIEKSKDDYAFIALAVMYALVVVLVVKLITAVVFTVLSYKYKKEIRVINSNVGILNESAKPISTFKAVVKDLTRPLFLLSFILMSVFIWQVNGSYSQKIWMSLRPLAIAFVLFYIIRSPWVAKKLFAYSKKSKIFANIYEKSQKAYQMVMANSKKD